MLGSWRLDLAMGGFGFVCLVPGMWDCGLVLFACPGLWVYLLVFGVG